MIAEDDPRWRKSKHSDNDGNCVEVAHVGDVVGVRDSKDPAGGHFELSPAAFTGFLAVVGKKENREE